jgi:DNA repair exonuclease SbcCD ATPase subunit
VNTFFCPVVAASKHAAARDDALDRARELEKKLKMAEDARAAAEAKLDELQAEREAKLDELRAQTAEREEALTARLNAMVEDLTGMSHDLFCSTLLDPSLES